MQGSSVAERGGTEVRVSTRAADKFAFVRDLGYVRVPREWGQAVCYRDLQILCSLVSSGWDPRISEPSFPRATHELRPYGRYRFRLFEPVNPGSATVYEDSLKFLESQKALLVGVPGLVLLMTEKQDSFQNQLSEHDMVTMPDRRQMLFRDVRSEAYSMPTSTFEGGKFNVELHETSVTWAPQQRLLVVTEFLRPQ